MRKFFLIAFLCLFTKTWAERVEIDGITYTLDSSTKIAEVVGCDFEYQGTAVIQSYLENNGITYTVTTIRDYAFSGRTGLTSIIISSTITKIGECVFNGCTELTTIDVSSGNTEYSSKDGVLYNKDMSSLIKYPENKKNSSYVIPNTVTSIGESAFWGCSGLTNISIPNSVISIGDMAFSGCSGLTNIDIPNLVTNIGYCAFSGCSGLTNISISNSVTSIGEKAFSDCIGLTNISIPNSVTSIEDYAFYGCIGLTSISIPYSMINLGYNVFGNCKGLIEIGVSSENTEFSSMDGILYNKDMSSLIRYPEGKQNSSFVIPNSVTSIGHYAFSGCSGLTNISIPNSVTSIGSWAFEHCSGLTNIDIPNSVTSIGYMAFAGCSSLTSIIIPNRMRNIGNSVFSGCVIHDLYILSPDVSLGDLGNCECSTVYAYKSVLDQIDEGGYNTGYYYLGYRRKVEINNFFYTISEIRNISPSVITFRVMELPDCSESVTLARVEYNGTILYPDASGVYTITDIVKEDSHTISLIVKANETETTYQYQQVILNFKPEINMSVSSDQTNLNLSVNSKIVYTDYNVKEIGVNCNEVDYGIVPEKDRGYYKGKITVSDLVPNSQYYVYPYIIFDDNTRVEGKGNYYGTTGVLPKIYCSFNGPTACRACGCYDLGTATLKDATLYFDGKKCEGNNIYITGLDPNTKYILEYQVTTNEGSTETVKNTITTHDIELTTLQPKGVSERCSIVAATTNICDDEPNVGFQWKKYDAPESLKPSEGYAAIYDGQLEGYIKNLQPTSYYKVRAFYKSATDKYYYGDWVTFDPSDFSYFEPTVHTYEATDVTSTSAKVKGYVLAGTDNIIEQGFEYWPVNISQSKAMRVVAAENNVSTIFCTGQVMTATLTDLQPNTTYRFRSFVKTASGMTYGEEQMLTTAYDPTGIGGVETSLSEITVVGYYDINGRKLDGIGNGITIVRYSNGSVRKVVRK